MPFIANTPESLITRSDSRNPATTCRGITSAGRPCRRPLAAPSVISQSVGRFRPQCDTHTTVCLNRHTDFTDERMYCWQHKDQSSSFNCPSYGPQTPSITPAVYTARNSVDTLVERLQMLDIEACRDAKIQKPAHQSHRSREQGIATGTSFFCCFTEKHTEDVPLPPPRPKHQPTQARLLPSSYMTGKQHARWRSTAPGTAQFLSLFPTTTSPKTAAALIAELAKPVSQTDEPGYIYMFWMTPESQHGAPPTKAVRSLLVPPLRSLGGDQCRPGDVVASFAARDRGVSQRKDGTSIFGHQHTSLLLKIGRANNIQRRLNEWKRQCGYDISLIRYYPYTPASLTNSASSSSKPAPRMILHSHKVERLVHIELVGLGLHVTDRDKCGACGRGHREWFRVEATRDAVAAVDGVIRRWSDWDEGRG